MFSNFRFIVRRITLKAHSRIAAQSARDWMTRILPKVAAPQKPQMCCWRGKMRRITGYTALLVWSSTTNAGSNTKCEHSSTVLMVIAITDRNGRRYRWLM